jgi:hypothetical protein
MVIRLKQTKVKEGCSELQIILLFADYKTFLTLKFRGKAAGV